MSIVIVDDGGGGGGEKRGRSEGGTDDSTSSSNEPESKRQKVPPESSTLRRKQGQEKLDGSPVNKRLGSGRPANLEATGFSRSGKSPAREKASPVPKLSNSIASKVSNPEAVKPKRPLIDDDGSSTSKTTARSRSNDEQWEHMFAQLLRYKEKHNDCLVPSRFEENPKLGKWVETQRYEYTKLQRASGADVGEGVSGPTSTAANNVRASNARLTEQRIRRLEEIGFQWKVRHKMKRYYDQQWEEMLSRLVEFKDKHGHVLVPKRYPPDMKLGLWVHTQRISYRKLMAGKANKNTSEISEIDAAGEDRGGEELVSHRMTEERLQKLEQVGFVWSVKESEKGQGDTGKVAAGNSYDQQWNIMFQRLAAYKERNGHCLVPKRCKEDSKLGTWCDTQRVQKKKLEKKLAELGDSKISTASSKPVVGRLTDDRISRLESLGFTWSLRDDWQKHYEELLEFKKTTGHCNVPARYSVNRRLGIWVSAQRQQYKLRNNPQDPSKPKKSPLTYERIELLESMGFCWAVRSRDVTLKVAKRKEEEDRNPQASNNCEIGPDNSILEEALDAHAKKT